MLWIIINVQDSYFIENFYKWVGYYTCPILMDYNKCPGFLFVNTIKKVPIPKAIQEIAKSSYYSPLTDEQNRFNLNLILKIRFNSRFEKLMCDNPPSLIPYQ